MKNQIEKLSQQIASLQNNFNANSEDLLKSNHLFKFNLLTNFKKCITYNE